MVSKLRLVILLIALTLIGCDYLNDRVYVPASSKDSSTRSTVDFQYGVNSDGSSSIGFGAGGINFFSLTPNIDW